MPIPQVHFSPVTVSKVRSTQGTSSRASSTSKHVWRSSLRDTKGERGSSKMCCGTRSRLTRLRRRLLRRTRVRIARKQGPRTRHPSPPRTSQKWTDVSESWKSSSALRARRSTKCVQSYEKVPCSDTRIRARPCRHPFYRFSPDLTRSSPC